MIVGVRRLRSPLGEVTLTLFAPEPDGADMRCRYRVEGPRTCLASHAVGVDGIQALELALRKAAIELRLGEEFAAGGLAWLDSDEPGLPLPDGCEALGWKPPRKATDGAPVRPFRAEDAEAVAAMAADLNAEEGYDRGTAPAPEQFRAQFLGPGAAGAILVAEAGGGVAGYCTLHTSYETEFAQRGCYMGDLFVARAHRRKGLGGALVAAAAREVRRRGGTFLWWTSLPHNARAAAFYAALGATTEEVRAHALAGAAFGRLGGEDANA